MFLKSFLLPGSNQDEHHKHIATSFIYRNRYKFYATLNIKDIADVSHSLPNVLSLRQIMETYFVSKGTSTS